MQSKPSRWRCDPYEVAGGRRLAEGLGVSPVVGSILARRGFADVEEARRFLAAEESHDPLTLPGIPAACELILAHVERGSVIAVFGDYDVDGVCSTAMLLRTLRALGADPVWELPSRFDEGYGLSGPAVERLRGRGVDLLVTVDCGITAVEQVAAARTAGLDVVITDHHRPGDELPDCTVVHPALGEYGCPELCASGVVLKLSEALFARRRSRPGRGRRGHRPRRARHGVRPRARCAARTAASCARASWPWAARARPGLRALMEIGGVAPGELSEHALGFRLGPRINAAGRMQRADAALELLLTDDAARAGEVARELDLLNRDRQEAETRILFAAEAACAPQAHQGAIVVAGEGWHPGVVGIVASRLVERWRRPCVVIALDGQGGGRGSGRSISAYDLHAGLAACSEHLVRFGGHRMAAGVELEAGAVEPFRRALAAHAGAALSPEDLISVERVDAIVPGGDLGLGLAEELELLRPFGMGNPQPTLLVPSARFERVTGMGEDREHSRFTLVAAGGARSRGVAFGSPPKALEPALERAHDIALRLERNRWNGMVEPRVILRALCPTEPGELLVLGEDEPFWDELGALLAAPAGRARRGCLARSGSAAARRHRRGPPRRGLRRGRGRPLLERGDRAGGGRGRSAPPGRPGGRCGRALRRPDAGHLVGRAGGAPRARGGLRPPRRARPAARRHRRPAAPQPSRGPISRGALPRPSSRCPPARAELDLRPQLAEVYRALRELPPDAAAAELEAALRGSARYPRNARACARLARVLTELNLIELDPDARTCRILDAAQSDLELSPTYRASRDQLSGTERALAAELPRPLETAATG